MMDAALKILLEQGVLGAVAVLAMGSSVYMFRENRRLYERLVEKAEKMIERYNESIGKVNETINALMQASLKSSREHKRLRDVEDRED